MIRYVSVFLMDQAPSLGIGRRRLIVREGHKWVTAFNPFSCRRKVFTRAKWDELVKQEIETDPAKIIEMLALQFRKPNLPGFMRQMLRDNQPPGLRFDELGYPRDDSPG